MVEHVGGVGAAISHESVQHMERNVYTVVSRITLQECATKETALEIHHQAHQGDHSHHEMVNSETTKDPVSTD